MWSRLSQKDLENIVKYLTENFPEKSVLHFQDLLTFKLDLIARSPEIGQIVKNDAFKRSLQITKLTRIFYKIGKDEIKIVTLFDLRQDPGKLKSMGLAEPLISYSTVQPG